MESRYTEISKYKFVMRKENDLHSVNLPALSSLFILCSAEMERNMEQKLRALIAEAENVLKELAGSRTVYNENALRYMIQQSKSVLDGERLFPISGSRGFFEESRESSLQFLLSHYVMYGFDKGNDPHECYGLEKALYWFRHGEMDRQVGDVPEFSFEKEKEDYLLFSSEKWKKLVEEIGISGFKAKQYEAIRQIAGRHSIEEVKNVWESIWDGKELPESKSWYSDTSQGINMQAPVGAAALRLGFRNAPAEDKQTEFHIKGIRLAGANGEEWEIEKEQGVFLNAGEDVWQSKELIPVQPGQMYTVHFKVNQHQKCKKGIELFVQFLDQEGIQIEESCHPYNRKAYYPAIFAMGLEAQCNAICYGVTKEESYAELAVYELLLFMDDFCQGAAYWMLYGARPEGRDNYGAVQAGRVLCVIAQSYAFVKRSSVWSEKQRERFVKMAEFILNDTFDLRDRTCLSVERAQRGTGNWQTDMCIGAAMIAAAVEEIPYRKQWILNAEAVLSAQLQCTLNADGSWPESLRYHHAALEHFCTFAIFWENETGKPWKYKKSLNDMYALSIGVQMPPYCYFGGTISTPPFGDHRLSGGNEYQSLGLWIEQAARTDRQLAAQMLETWERAGSPMYGFGTERMAVENLMFADKTLLCLPEPDTGYRLSSRAFPDAGLYLFRKKEQEKSAALAVMANEKRIGHGHRDQGSFIYYYQDIPLIMDGGIESYFDASTQWHVSSYAHACMQFQTKQSVGKESTEINLSAGGYSARKGWCDTPGTVTVQKVCLDAGQETIQMRIENPEGQGYQTRTILFEKPEEITVRDSVSGFKGEILFSLPLLAEEAHILDTDGTIVCRGKGYYGVHIEVQSLLPIKRAWVEPGSVTAMHPGAREGRQIPYLRFVADADTGFHVVIRAGEEILVEASGR